MVELVVIVGVCLVFFVPGAITVAKGHIALFFAGLLVSLVWPIVAFRLAKPNSPWAGRYYGPEKLRRSKRRYTEIDVDSPSRAGLAAVIGFGIIAATLVGGVIAGMAQGSP
jgi:hypothetical protein